MDAEPNGAKYYAQFFDFSEAGFPFTAEVVKQLVLRRTLLSHALLFDGLLSQAGVSDAQTKFPPHDSRELAALLGDIANSEWDDLKKDSLVVYLLAFSTDDDARSEFIKARCIPPHFIMLADAYFELDTGENVSRAVSLLSDRRIARDNVSKIMEAIATPPQATENWERTFPQTTIPNVSDTADLIARYVHTAKPLLVQPLDIDLYIISLAEGLGASGGLGISRAWRFQRTFAEHSPQRARLIRLLLDWCFLPDFKGEALKTMLALPFSPAERSLVHAYAASPSTHFPPKALSALRDFVTVRLLSAGSYGPAIRLDAKLALAAPASAAPGGSYAAAARSRPGPREAEQGARERKQLLADVLAALPPAERAALEDDGVQPPAPADARDYDTAWRDIAAADATDVAESWEQISARPPRISTRGGVEAVSARSGATRFGLGVPQPGSRPAGTSASAGPSSMGANLAPGVDSATPVKSANRARNAFFEPPTTPAQAPGMDSASPIREEAAEEGPPADSQETAVAEEEEDVDMSLDYDKENTPEVAAPGQTFPFSVFGAYLPPPAASPGPLASRAGTAAPPGAYVPTPEPEQAPAIELAPEFAPEPEAEPATNGEANGDAEEVEVSSRRRTRRAASNPPTSPQHSKKRDRKRTVQDRADDDDAAHVQAEETSPAPISAGRRRVPGALDDNTVDSEDADEVPPLPTSTRTSTRSRRAATAATISGGTLSDTEDDHGPITRRRSSRISTVVEEAPAPQKKKTRASTAANGKKESSRRKR